MSIISSILVSTIIYSCSQKKEKTDTNLKEYCEIIFKSNKKNVYVDNHYSYSEELVKQKNGKYEKIEKKLTFTKKECDSLAKYAYQIIKNPTLSHTILTCGAGENISIEISYCGTSIACKYSSIESWSTLSNDNRKLYNILNSKTAIPK
ncbi:hypothetical protein [Flavobacterium mesophilum]|uniref:hypothetical protein n=1 Tax=Flavobacterium mesophilum TaxID=3143495 RepID=UPI0031E1117B